MRLMGLTGIKGCGKSTFARTLRKEYGFGIISFATPIKQMLIAMGVPEQNINDPQLKELPWGELPSPRFLMQTLGTEWARKIIGEGVWVTIARNKILSETKDWVIDDVRFVNEVEMIHDLGGMIVRLNPPNPTCSDDHVSEKKLDGELIDFELRDYWDKSPEDVVTNFMETGSNGAFYSTKPLSASGQ